MKKRKRKNNKLKRQHDRWFSSKWKRYICVCALVCICVFVFTGISIAGVVYILSRTWNWFHIDEKKQKTLHTANSCATNFDAPSIMAFTALFKISKCHKQFFILFTVPINTLSTVSLNCYKEDFQVDLQKHTSQFTITFFISISTGCNKEERKNIHKHTHTK